MILLALLSLWFTWTNFYMWYGAKVGVHICFSFCIWIFSCSNIISWQYYLSALNCTGIFPKMNWPARCMVIPPCSLFYAIDLYILSSHQYRTALIIVPWRWALKSGCVSPLTLFFLVSILGYTSSFVISYTF